MNKKAKEIKEKIAKPVVKPEEEEEVIDLSIEEDKVEHGNNNVK